MSDCIKCGSESRRYRVGDSHQTCEDCGHKQKKPNSQLKWEKQVIDNINRFSPNFWVRDDGSEE
jgi:uncharacterized membrane protein YvbJ